MLFRSSVGSRATLPASYNSVSKDSSISSASCTAGYTSPRSQAASSRMLGLFDRQGKRGLTIAAAKSGNTSIELRWAPLTLDNWFQTSAGSLPFQASRFWRGLEFGELCCSGVRNQRRGVLCNGHLSLGGEHQTAGVVKMRDQAQAESCWDGLQRPVIRGWCCGSHC